MSLKDEESHSQQGLGILNTLVNRFLLGKSRFMGRLKIPKEMFRDSKLSELQMRETFLRELTVQLANKIRAEFPNAIVEEDEDRYKTIRIELLVMETKDFKRVVEAAIEMLTDEQIAMIRNGVNVIR